MRPVELGCRPLDEGLDLIGPALTVDPRVRENQRRGAGRFGEERVDVLCHVHVSMALCRVAP